MHRHILIEAVSPCVDGGRHAAKTPVGEPFTVEADIFRDGHCHLRAIVKWREKGAPRFTEVPMRHLENDRFRGEFVPTRNAPHEFAVEAWTDRYESWLDDFEKKVTADRDVTLDVREGIELVRDAATRASGEDAPAFDRALAGIAEATTPAESLGAFSKQSLRDAIARADQREDVVADSILPVMVLPAKAWFGTWYEFFPRSEATDPARGATLREAE
ncbi:MAG TPA: maltotransferase domain-containing protein, partial [Polyangiaceae bacterium]|nr:maltotransferase domain-containing protein [Polyangiaceae bacterium]